jgi:TonB family protein
MIDVLSDHPALGAVGLALVHFVWQGAAIAAGTAALLAVLRRQSANVRYLIACAALAAMAVTPVITAVASAATHAPGASGAAFAATVVDVGASRLFSRWLGSRPGVLSVVVFAWLAGVALLTVRLAHAWLAVRAFTSRATTPLRDDWRMRVQMLARRVGVSRVLRMTESSALDVPAVVGWLRPMLVVPASVFAGLAPAQLDAILAHELAHVRRHDFLVNLGQTVVETLLFYHPGVWWISSRIRIERELCCDDAAAAVCGDPVTYARALASLEGLRQGSPALAVAANGGSLMKRIQRLLDVNRRTSERAPAWAIVLVSLSLALVPAFANHVAAQAPADRQTAPLVIGGSQAAPHKIGGAPPVYPADAKAAGEAGMVFVTAVIDAEGDVADATVLRAASPRLGQAAVDAIRTWKYQPTLVNGVPTPVSITITVNFSLDESSGAITSTRAPAFAASSDALRVGGAVSEPRKVRHVPPAYPDDARAAGIEGTVILDALIDADGYVTDVEVLQSVPMLDRAAVEAVKQWRYLPTLLNGEARPIWMTITIKFTLQ